MMFFDQIARILQCRRRVVFLDNIVMSAELTNPDSIVGFQKFLLLGIRQLGIFPFGLIVLFLQYRALSLSLIHI